MKPIAILRFLVLVTSVAFIGCSRRASTLAGPPSGINLPSYKGSDGGSGPSVGGPTNSYNLAPLPVTIGTETARETLALITVVGASSASSETGSVSTTFTNDHPAVIKITGEVSGDVYTSVVQNAGVNARITIDGEKCAENLSFESYSATVYFHSAATCIKLLQPGTHELRVYDTDEGFYSNMSQYSSHLQYEVFPAPGQLSPVIEAKEVSNDGSTATATIQNPVPVVVDIAGYIYNDVYTPGNIQNAGVLAKISIDGSPCTSALSFEAYASTVPFNASTNCIKVLQPGTHQISVADGIAGYPNMQGATATLQYMVFAAPTSDASAPVVATNETSNNGESATTTFTNSSPVVLDIAGFTQATVNASMTENAGVDIQVQVDGTECASSLVFQALIANLTFQASAGCILVVPAGPHTITVRDRSAGSYGSMGNRKTTLQYYLVGAPQS